MRTYEFVVGKAEAGSRLDRYLAHRVPASISRSAIQRAVRQGAVRVGDRPVKANQKLHLGDVIMAHFEQLPARSTNAMLFAQPIPLEVVYEDADVLVVNKPAGLVTHPAPGHWDGTLVNAILWHLEQQHATGNTPQGLPRAGIVHRLDKDTSGLLIVAKTESAHTVLSKQLKTRTLSRRYLALVQGHVPLDQGTINVSIGRHLTRRKEMTVRHLGGRAAVTHYRVLKRLAVQDPHAERLFPYSVLEVSLETGRTHQIRVHVAHLGYPVLGDVTYSKHPVSFWHALGISRQLLHAQAIRFQHPVTGASVELNAPIPQDILSWLENRGS